GRQRIRALDRKGSRASRGAALGAGKQPAFSRGGPLPHRKHLPGGTGGSDDGEAPGGVAAKHPEAALANARRLHYASHGARPSRLIDRGRGIACFTGGDAQATSQKSILGGAEAEPLLSAEEPITEAP